MKSLTILAAMSALGALGYSQLPEKRFILPWHELSKKTGYILPDRPKIVEYIRPASVEARKAEYLPPAPVTEPKMNSTVEFQAPPRKAPKVIVRQQVKPSGPSFEQIYAAQYGTKPPPQVPVPWCTPSRQQIMHGMPVYQMPARPITGQAQTPWLVNGQAVRPAY